MEGNQVKIREALENLVYNIELRASVFDIFSIVDRKAWMDAKAALAAPPRQCDVGTADEQMKRQHDTMCNTTKACPDSDWSCKKCFAEWAQMPYTEEFKKKIEHEHKDEKNE